MRIRCYKNGTDCISNIIKEQEVTSCIAHPLDILLFCTVLKGPLWHRMFLTFSVCPTLVRHEKREKGEMKAVIISVYSTVIFQARLRQKKQFFLSEEMSQHKYVLMQLSHRLFIQEKWMAIPLIFFRPTITFFCPSLHE